LRPGLLADARARIGIASMTQSGCLPAPSLDSDAVHA
jgi:hypothetical protein